MALSDPTSLGAETQAPPTLQPSVDPDGVSFQLSGPRRSAGLRPGRRTTVRVHRLGIVFEDNEGRVEAAFEELTGCDVATLPGEGCFLVLRCGGRAVASAPVVDSAEVGWLAAYLNAGISRFRGAADDPRAARAELDQLESLLGTSPGRRR